MYQIAGLVKNVIGSIWIELDKEKEGEWMSDLVARQISTYMAQTLRKRLVFVCVCMCVCVCVYVLVFSVSPYR